ncbi:MAG: hypothetical protein IPL33_21110 [Sphingobacteriales bacterium]|nr:hypothetical protein [Sphingobacteriales bacterium]
MMRFVPLPNKRLATFVSIDLGSDSPHAMATCFRSGFEFVIQRIVSCGCPMALPLLRAMNRL